MNTDVREIRRWDEETDVVVVGAGLAGYSAALEAAARGSEVIMLEKQERVGGSSRICGGFFAFAETDHQREQGIEDSNERLFEDMLAVGGHENDERVVRAFVEEQLDTYRWLVQKGVPFGVVKPSSGQSAPRTHPTNSAELIEILDRHAQSTDSLSLRMNTPVVSLIRDGNQGPVEGVLAESEGKQVAIRARGGVVLTSGGFTQNVELLKKFVPEKTGVQRMGGAGNTGDGLRMAWRLGAGVADTAHIKGTFGNHPSAGTDKHLLNFPVYRGAIAVNKLGKRFVDESISYKLLGDACLQQPDKMAYQIFDQEVMSRSEPGVLTFDFEEAFKGGLMLTAPTLEELAVKIGLEPSALAETVEEYNEFVLRGKDEQFGRTSLSTNYGDLVQIKKSPFYAFPSTTVILGTYCGVTVDETCRVVDVFEEPIERLYAAGEVMGGFHGKAYMTGSGLSKAAVFGRLSGRQAAMAAEASQATRG